MLPKEATMASDEKRILLVEDEKAIRDAVAAQDEGKVNGKIVVYI